MNSEIICEICSQIVSSPAILTCCYSTVCTECARKLSVREANAFEKSCYKCPSCRKDHYSHAFIRYHTFLSRYIEFCHKQGKFQTVNCHNCQKPVNSSETCICSACGNNYLCKECDTSIHAAEDKKNHVRVSVSSVIKKFAGSLNKTITCNTHTKEQMEYLCLRDMSTLCKFCVPSHTKACPESRIMSFE